MVQQAMRKVQTKQLAPLHFRGAKYLQNTLP
jgi:hypothetical protein